MNDPQFALIGSNTGMKWRNGCVHPADNPVDVWQFELDLAADEVAELERVLSPDEQARASRFRHANDRDRYIVAHGSLRMLLGRYIDESPGQLEFSHTPNGKPRLVNPAHPALCFNMSHSGKVALVAVACGREVGIDVERIDLNCDFESVAREFFAPAEQAALRTSPSHERCNTFFQLWTCKESVLKAMGEGFQRSPASISLTLQRDQESVALEIPQNPTEAGRWSTRILPGITGYAAALTIAGEDSEQKRNIPCLGSVCWPASSARPLLLYLVRMAPFARRAHHVFKTTVRDGSSRFEKCPFPIRLRSNDWCRCGCIGSASIP
jgi:4'-phosphopantetheinyl transferase